MRRFWAVTAFVSVFFVTGLPAASMVDQAEDTRPARTAVISQTLDLLAEAAASSSGDDTQAAWISELSGVYAAEDATPMWTSDSGLTARGEAVIGELRSANLYGLEPDKFDLPAPGDTAAQSEVKLSLAVAKYVWHARGGRVDPSQLSLWLDQTPRTVYASTIVREIANSDDPAAALRQQHPQHPQFEALRQGLLRAKGLKKDIKPQPIQSGPKIIQGDRHDDVALIRRRLGLSSGDNNDTLADEDFIDAIREFMRKAGFGKKKGYVDDEVRNAINAAADGPKTGDKALIEKILINMERWRWLPHNMGGLYVWNNIPEYESRIVKNGQTIHRERIIVGQPHTQTPVFSDAMSQVIFQPTWGVPPSIKLRQFGGRGNIADLLQRRNMKIIDDDGTVIRPSRIKWGKVDIRHIPIVQGPGPGNPLGRLKFIFPNAHAVYMHDTPDKYLFKSSERAFSHGCMRLRNPQRYAELILGLTKGWTPEAVAQQLTYKDTIKVILPTQIPVHVTYFTVVVDDHGSLRQLKDIYGHDKRIADAFAGVPYKRIAARDPARAQLEQNKELARKARGSSKKPGRSR